MTDKMPGDMPADWAVGRARELTGTMLWTNGQGRHHTPLETFARYIEAHESPPVDLALAEARKLFAAQHRAGRYDLTFAGGVAKYGAAEAEILRGDFDKHGILLLMESCLRRGLELGQTPND